MIQLPLNDWICQLEIICSTHKLFYGTLNIQLWVETEQNKTDIPTGNLGHLEL